MFRLLLSRSCSLNARHCSTASAVKMEMKNPDKLFKCIDIELRAHEPAVLKSYSWFMNTSASELDITVEKSFAPEEPDKARKTLLKSAHVHKKHRVQYEMRTYYHFITLKHLTGSTADTYLEYVQRNLPEGVSMKVTTTELMKQLSKLQPPSSSS
ncbi:28S ribosomal protein S10, mitochondrial [Eurytemora carolleeae]|uniref:28S ribosomal protein S10, mitochondrial n=1 Tax=Eurytemora carolleeae TaxID=1294199 RepID=UPI000C786F0B|nr:28S ribosomal protein S10, mitochondrial [Eurytemora carolleeae]|eukprot:XP_023348056.1 28S ribosomal protein S10, mitochondrial-like [Eurytemora affinis]